MEKEMQSCKILDMNTLLETIFSIDSAYVLSINNEILRPLYDMQQKLSEPESEQYEKLSLINLSVQYLIEYYESVVNDLSNTKKNILSSIHEIKPENFVKTKFGFYSRNVTDNERFFKEWKKKILSFLISLKRHHKSIKNSTKLLISNLSKKHFTEKEEEKVKIVPVGRQSITNLDVMQNNSSVVLLQDDSNKNNVICENPPLIELNPAIESGIKYAKNLMSYYNQGIIPSTLMYSEELQRKTDIKQLELSSLIFIVCQNFANVKLFEEVTTIFCLPNDEKNILDTMYEYQTKNKDFPFSMNIGEDSLKNILSLPKGIVFLKHFWLLYGINYYWNVFNFKKENKIEDGTESDLSNCFSIFLSASNEASFYYQNITQMTIDKNRFTWKMSPFLLVYCIRLILTKEISLFIKGQFEFDYVSNFLETIISLAAEMNLPAYFVGLAYARVIIEKLIIPLLNGEFQNKQSDSLLGLILEKSGLKNMPNPGSLSLLYQVNEDTNILISADLHKECLNLLEKALFHKNPNECCYKFIFHVLSHTHPLMKRILNEKDYLSILIASLSLVGMREYRRLFKVFLKKTEKTENDIYSENKALSKKELYDWAIILDNQFQASLTKIETLNTAHDCLFSSKNLMIESYFKGYLQDFLNLFKKTLSEQKIMEEDYYDVISTVSLIEQMYKKYHIDYTDISELIASDLDQWTLSLIKNFMSIVNRILERGDWKPIEGFHHTQGITDIVTILFGFLSNISKFLSESFTMKKIQTKLCYHLATMVKDLLKVLNDSLLPGLNSLKHENEDAWIKLTNKLLIYPLAAITETLDETKFLDYLEMQSHNMSLYVTRLWDLSFILEEFSDKNQKNTFQYFDSFFCECIPLIRDKQENMITMVCELFQKLIFERLMLWQLYKDLNVGLLNKSSYTQQYKFNLKSFEGLLDFLWSFARVKLPINFRKKFFLKTLSLFINRLTVTMLLHLNKKKKEKELLRAYFQKELDYLMEYLAKCCVVPHNSYIKALDYYEDIRFIVQALKYHELSSKQLNKVYEKANPDEKILLNDIRVFNNHYKQNLKKYHIFNFILFF